MTAWQTRDFLPGIKKICLISYGFACPGQVYPIPAPSGLKKTDASLAQATVACEVGPRGLGASEEGGTGSCLIQT